MIGGRRGTFGGLLVAAFVVCGHLPADAATSSCAAAADYFRERGAFSSLRAKLQRKERVLILAIGSSSTAGVGASSPGNNYPARLQSILWARWNVETAVSNAGVPGEAASATLIRLRALLAKEKPDLVIWQVGTNDALRGEQEDRFRSVLERGVAETARAGVDMILIDPQYFPSVPDPSRYERYAEIVGEIGAQRRVSVFSRYGLMRGWAERAPAELAASLSSDGFHLSDRGYACLAGLLAEGLNESTGGPAGLAEAGARP